MFAALFVDLDRFKTVNDTLGHTVGDQLLVEAAARISAAVRETDTVARLGGDEFVVVCEEIDGVHNATDAADRILAALRAPFCFGGDDVQVSASIGIALCADGTETSRRDPRQRGHRDVPGEGERPRRLRALRRGDATVGDRSGRARSRAPAGAPARRAPAVLPAVPRGGDRCDPRLRGARALGPSRIRTRRPRHLHPRGRGQRPDRRHRCLGARRSVPARGGVGEALAGERARASPSTCRRASSSPATSSTWSPPRSTGVVSTRRSSRWS